MIGFIRGFMFLFYTYAFGMGSIWIEKGKINKRTDEPYTTGDVLNVAVGLLMGFMMLLTAMPNIQAIVGARVKGKAIFDIIDRKPHISDGDKNIADIKLKNEISFDNVTFKYPTATDKALPVYKNATFKIPAGTSTAIVGPSGSGKSTIVQMIERFYDPNEGAICFDGTNIKDYNLKALRESIGYV